MASPRAALLTGADPEFGQTIATALGEDGWQLSIESDPANNTDAAKLIRTSQNSLGTPVTLLVSVSAQAPIDLAHQFASAIPTDEAAVIIYIFEQPALELNPEFGTYTVPQSPIINTTHRLAQALAPNIRVNAISLPAAPQIDEHSANMIATLRYMIDAQSLTGQIITIDGK